MSQISCVDDVDQREEEEKAGDGESISLGNLSFAYWMRGRSCHRRRWLGREEEGWGRHRGVGAKRCVRHVDGRCSRCAAAAFFFALNATSLATNNNTNPLQPPPTGLCDLDDSLLSKVLNMLDPWPECANAASTCRRLHALATDKGRW